MVASDASQENRDQLHSFKNQQTEMPTVDESQEKLDPLHPITSQALAWQTRDVSRKDSFELSKHLDNCLCWETVRSKFTKVKKYFRKVVKKDGEYMLLVASNGKPVVLEATVWMPIHVLFGDERNLVNE